MRNVAAVKLTIYFLHWFHNSGSNMISTKSKDKNKTERFLFSLVLSLYRFCLAKKRKPFNKGSTNPNTQTNRCQTGNFMNRYINKWTFLKILFSFTVNFSRFFSLHLFNFFVRNKLSRISIGNFNCKLIIILANKFLHHKIPDRFLKVISYLF